MASSPLTPCRRCHRLSSGLEYDVASYSNTDEVVAMAAEAAKAVAFT